MLVKEGINISKFSDERWVLNTSEGRNILLNESTSVLIEILKKNTSHNDATVDFNKKFDAQLKTEDFIQLINSKFSGFNVLKHDDSEPYKKGKYLNLKIPFFSTKVSGALARPFTWLFTTKIFWASTLVLLISAVFIFTDTLHLSVFEIGNIDLFLFGCLVYPSVLFHEIGHIAACKASRIRHGGIGFAFYFIIPVLYSDVTNVWQASKGRRIITNLAGIFGEITYASILAIIFYQTHNSTLLAAYYVIVIKALFELNPFIRSDGYWILSDITNTPNLLQKAKLNVKKLSDSLFKKKTTRQPISKTTIWLSVYGIGNSLVLFLYSGYMLINHKTTIINFPIILWEIMQKVVHLKFSADLWEPRYFLVLAFYWIIIRALYGMIKKKLASVAANGLFRMTPWRNPKINPSGKN